MTPSKPKRPCSYPGCGILTVKGRCDAHPISTKQYDKRRGSAASRGYDGRWQKIRSAVLLSEPLCRECMKSNVVTVAREVHHVRPLAQGGTHDYDNLVPLCKACHSKITIMESGYNAGR